MENDNYVLTSVPVIVTLLIISEGETDWAVRPKFRGSDLSVPYKRHVRDVLGKIVVQKLSVLNDLTTVLRKK